jgi:predicted nucleic-acid-binding protein
VKIVPDTNVLARFIVGDEPAQARIAKAQLAGADVVAIGTASLCELVWVLSKIYKRSATDIARAIRVVIGAENVAVNQRAVEAGLAVLGAGGDFADGAIAYEGLQLGGEVFASFDKKAVSLVKANGAEAIKL